MKLILTQDVRGLGKKGDVVEVSTGYARNKLLPQKLAMEMTSKNMNDLKLQKEHEEKVAIENLKEAEELAKNLEGKTVTVKIKSGKDGQVFGSISTKEIAEEAKKQIDLTLDKKKMVLDEPIKSLGFHEVKLKLHPKVVGVLKVHVVEA